MESILDRIDLEQAFSFYGIDEGYKDRCYACMQSIAGNALHKEAFQNVFERIYCGDFKEVKIAWRAQSTEELFCPGIDPFCTNLMVLAGLPIHKKNLEKLGPDQVAAHKMRVKGCFENDLKNRGYPGIRINQMLWAVHFIRMRIIEVGILQYEYTETDDGDCIVKIHIPGDNRLDIASVERSLTESKPQLKKVFGVHEFKYLCNSWLLSNGVYEILDKSSNIAKFHDLFQVRDGKDCVHHILNFVFQLDACGNYSALPEKTSLQRKLKAQLLQGKSFYSGIGTLK